MTDIMYLFGAGLATFLVGANAAFLVQLGRQLATWFIFKVIGNCAIMLYMSMSMFVGDPGPWRAAVGITALMIDVIAMVWMWAGIERLRKEGVEGFIPIARLSVPKS